MSEYLTLFHNIIINDDDDDDDVRRNQERQLCGITPRKVRWRGW